MPPAILAAFHMDAFNQTTITGFFGVMFAYFGLILSISAVLWGSIIISIEERDKTVEFALTQPVTRGKLITANSAAALVNCIVLALVSWGAVRINAEQYQPDSKFYEFAALGMLALLIMQLIFLAVGIFIGCAMRQHKRSGSAAVSLLLGTYFISIAAGLYKDLDFLQYLSPFTYFNPVELLRDAKLDMSFVWLSAGIVVVSLAGA